MNSKFYKFGLFVILIICVLCIAFLNQNNEEQDIISLNLTLNHKTILKERCTFYKCSNIRNVYKYGFKVNFSQKIIGLNINPMKNIESAQFLNLKRSIILNKRFFNLNNSSLIIINFDFLTVDTMFPFFLEALYSSKSFDDVGNYLIFNFIMTKENLNYVLTSPFRFMLASSSFYHPYYRHGFDISIPAFNTGILSVAKLNNVKYARCDYLYCFTPLYRRVYSCFIMQLLVREVFPNIVPVNTKAGPKFFVVVRERCQETKVEVQNICAELIGGGSVGHVNEPLLIVAEKSVFCVIFKIGDSLPHHLFTAMSRSCIPVIFADDYILPFSEVLDWVRCSISMRENQISDLYSILGSISADQIHYYQRHIEYYFTRYMSTMARVVDTGLAIIESRFLPYRARSSLWWNDPDYDQINSDQTEEAVAKKMSARLYHIDRGFTAVIISDLCDTAGAHIAFNAHLQSLLLTNGLVHLIIVSHTQCNIDPLSLNEYRVTRIQLSAHENSVPIKYHELNVTDTDAVLILRWHKSTARFSTAEINHAFTKWWSAPSNRMVAIRSGECLHTNGTRLRYPLNGIFVAKALMNVYKTVASTATSINTYSSHCCNNDIALTYAALPVLYTAATSDETTTFCLNTHSQ